MNPRMKYALSLALAVLAVGVAIGGARIYRKAACRRDVGLFRTWMRAVDREGMHGLYGQRADTRDKRTFYYDYLPRGELVALDEVPARGMDVPANVFLILFSIDPEQHRERLFYYDGRSDLLGPPLTIKRLAWLIDLPRAELQAERTSVLVVIPKTAAWEHVAFVLEALASAGVQSVEFVFQGRSSLEPPPPTKETVQELESRTHIDGTGRSAYFDFLTSLGAPSQMFQVVNAASEVESGSPRVAAFADRMPPTLEACGCSWLPTAKFIYWDLHGRYDVTPSWVSRRMNIGRASDLGAVPIRAASKATWATVSTRVLAAAAKGERGSFIAVEEGG